MPTTFDFDFWERQDTENARDRKERTSGGSRNATASNRHDQPMVHGTGDEARTHTAQRGCIQYTQTKKTRRG